MSHKKLADNLYEDSKGVRYAKCPECGEKHYASRPAKRIVGVGVCDCGYDARKVKNG